MLMLDQITIGREGNFYLRHSIASCNREIESLSLFRSLASALIVVDRRQHNNVHFIIDKKRKKVEREKWRKIDEAENIGERIEHTKNVIEDHYFFFLSFFF